MRKLLEIGDLTLASNIARHIIVPDIVLEKKSDVQKYVAGFAGAAIASFSALIAIPFAPMIGFLTANLLGELFSRME